VEPVSVSLGGLDAAAAREYVLGYVSTLKLTEKEIERVTGEEALWERRMKTAQSYGRDDLYAEAQKEYERQKTKKGELETEAQTLTTQIANLKDELRLLPAKERSIDPDLLEQELLILNGRMPGSEQEAARDRNFAELEKDAAAESALAALKAKMKDNF
jgi:phage shock protein A